jgi:hypothetical protein
MSTRNRKIIMFLGSKVRPVRRADNLVGVAKNVMLLGGSVEFLLAWESPALEIV